MATNKPQFEVVLREWENKFYGKEQNGKKYIGKDFTIVRASIDKRHQSVCIELIEQLEQSDFTIEEYSVINSIWLLSVEEYAKVRKFVDEWIKWCEANDFSLDFFS